MSIYDILFFAGPVFSFILPVIQYGTLIAFTWISVNRRWAVEVMNIEQLNDNLDDLWKNGRIEKKYVPFIKTAVNRPLWASWHFFFRGSISGADPKMILLGFKFLGYRYRGYALSFLYKYFPGLIVFPYFEAIWDENASDKMDQIDPIYFVRLFDKDFAADDADELVHRRAARRARLQKSNE